MECPKVDLGHAFSSFQETVNAKTADTIVGSPDDVRAVPSGLTNSCSYSELASLIRSSPSDFRSSPNSFRPTSISPYLIDFEPMTFAEVAKRGATPDSPFTPFTRKEPEKKSLDFDEVMSQKTLRKHFKKIKKNSVDSDGRLDKSIFRAHLASNMILYYQELLRNYGSLDLLFDELVKYQRHVLIKSLARYSKKRSYDTNRLSFNMGFRVASFHTEREAYSNEDRQLKKQLNNIELLGGLDKAWMELKQFKSTINLQCNSPFNHVE